MVNVYPLYDSFGTSAAEIRPDGLHIVDFDEFGIKREGCLDWVTRHVGCVLDVFNQYIANGGDPHTATKLYIKPMKELLEHKIDQAKRDLEEKQKEVAKRNREEERALSEYKRKEDEWHRAAKPLYNARWSVNFLEGEHRVAGGLVKEAARVVLEERRSEMEDWEWVLNPQSDELNRAKAARDQARAISSDAEIVEGKAKERLESMSKNVILLEGIEEEYKR